MNLNLRFSYCRRIFGYDRMDCNGNTRVLEWPQSVKER